MRSSITDNRTMPVVNLATNPNFERAATGATTVRKNVVLNPSLLNNVTGWSSYATGGTSTVSRVSGQFLSASAFARSTVTSSSIGSLYTMAGSVAGAVPVIEGRTYTGSIYGRPSWSTHTQISIEWYNASGAWITQAESAPQPHAAGVIERRSVTSRAAAGATWAKIIFKKNSGTGTSPSLNDTLDASMALMEERPSLLPYFDGTTTNSSGIAYSWEGTASASASVAKAAVTEVRRNLLTTPRGNSWTSWPGNGGTSTIALQTGSGLVQSDQFARMVLTAQPSSGAQSLGLGTNIPTGISITAGNVYSFGIYVRHAVTDGVGSARQEVKWFDSSNVQVGASISSNPASLGPNIWQLLRMENLTAPVGAVKAQIFGGILMASGQIAAVNSTVDATAGVAESGAKITGYFDGYTTPDADLTPMWAGATDNSASVLYGVTPAGIATGLSGRVGIRSWSAHEGSASLRNINGSSYAGIWLPSPTTLSLGKTYTALARAHYPVASVNGVDTQGRAILYGGGYGGGGTNQYVQFPNSPGTYSLRLTFTVNGNEQFIRLGGSGDIGGSVYWDQLAIVEGTYTGPYLDGDMPGCIWRGTPHASTSTGYPPSL